MFVLATIKFQIFKRNINADQCLDNLTLGLYDINSETVMCAFKIRNLDVSKSDALVKKMYLIAMLYIPRVKRQGTDHIEKKCTNF